MKSELLKYTNNFFPKNVRIYNSISKLSKKELRFFDSRQTSDHQTQVGWGTACRTTYTAQKKNFSFVFQKLATAALYRMEVGFSSKMRQNTIIFYSRYFDKYLFNYMTYKLDKNVMLLTYIAKRDNNLQFSYVSRDIIYIDV